MEAFERLPEEINELVGSFSSTPLFGTLKAGMTQYTFWLIVASIVVVALLFAYSRRARMVPNGKFVNAMEYIVEFVENDICKGVLGDSWRRHFPFLASVFFFVLINNIVGIIPGMKPGTGTISMTAALAIVVFIYFIAVGVKAKGAGGYLKSFAPAGVAFPLNALVWLIELVSTILRPITLAVRLFCNMFAGHVVMGSFAIMVALFADPLIEQVTAMNILGALPGVLFALILFVIYAIEIFVAAVQAYVFTVLSAVYIQGAEAKSH